LLSFIEALLLHGETRPMTGLPARATSATSRSCGKMCGGWGESQSLAKLRSPLRVFACDARTPFLKSASLEYHKRWNKRDRRPLKGNATADWAHPKGWKLAFAL